MRIKFKHTNDYLTSQPPRLGSHLIKRLISSRVLASLASFRCHHRHLRWSAPVWVLSRLRPHMIGLDTRRWKPSPSRSCRP